ncbi:unnamed protein product, partial [Phaeothamnion confervicola]
PLHFLLALFDATPGFRAADAVVFAHLFLGGIGIVLIFRDRGWHSAGALVAALAFAFGGSNASRLQHIGQIESLSYLPLALWLLMRTLDRSSWRWGSAAGVAGGLIMIGRDQVALLGLYVLTGFVVWHWLDGPGRRARWLASIKPLAAGAVAGTLVAIVPVVLTALLAAQSNRIAIDYETAVRGSLHPAHFLMMVFADVFGAADPNVPYWGPPSFPWHDAFGSTDLFHAQNIGQLYAGSLLAVVIIGLGALRGQLWGKEIRFFAIAALAILLYALGKYTPVFRAMYEFIPGVSLYRRPADASFVLVALLAVIAGYLVHRWLAGSIPAARRWQRIAEIATPIACVAVAVGISFAIGVSRQAVVPILTGIAFVAGAIGALVLARRLHWRSASAAAVVLAAFSTADLAWNNRPNESTGLPPSIYDALRPDTQNETVAVLKARLAQPGEARPRVELIGIGYHWPNIGLVQNFDHLFGHNPLRLKDFARATNASDTVAVPEQRQFSPLLASYKSPLENLFGVRFIATGVPAEQIDRSLRLGDLVPIGRTRDAYVYENARALPRVLLAGHWVIADFERMLANGWPDGWTPSTVFLERAPRPAFPPSTVNAGTARIVSYRNTEIAVEVETPASTVLVLNDVWHPWWRATLDGAPTEILKANVLFRGVAIPPGKHVVRFSFHPFAGALAEIWERFSGRR